MVDFAFNAPDVARFQVKFQNWSEHGIVINGPKCLMDAKNFRRAAKLILADARNDEDRAIGEWLNTLAGQFQNAAGGMDPQAEAAPYDEPPKAAQAEDKPAKTSEEPKRKRKAAAKGKASARGNRKRRVR